VELMETLSVDVTKVSSPIMKIASIIGSGINGN